MATSIRPKLISCLAAASAITIGAVATAQSPAPPDVFGKEYSAEFDWNAAGLPSPGQVEIWDGLGGWSDGVLLPSQEVDAIANGNDAFFSAVASDAADLVLSFRQPVAGAPFGIDAPGPTGALAGLWHSNSTPNGSARGVWAYTTPSIDARTPENIDGVELWGPNNDTNFWSNRGDAGGVAVWTTVGGPSPYISTGMIAAAIGFTPPQDLLDVDGLMVMDNFGVPGRFDVGDSIIFSLWANPVFDGGEIWVMTMTPAGPAASFLVHGGVTWDTANPVGLLFGINTEEIDAIEAIPTPGTLVLLALGGLTATRRRRV